MLSSNGTNDSGQPVQHAEETMMNATRAGPMLTLLEQLRRHNAKWLRVCWHDYTSTSRCRLIPMRRVLSLLERGHPLTISITAASLGLLQNDTPIPEITGTGVYDARPDWSSLQWGPIDGHSTVFLDFKDLDGADATLCPRTLLRNTVKNAGDQGLSLLLGFELEFVILETCAESQHRLPPKRAHGWSLTRAVADIGREGSFNSIIDELLSALESASIDIEQFHTEAAPGQYEVVLPPLPPLQACDTLLRTRHVVEAVAARHGFHMTLHPKPFASSIGSASHVHMSISSPGGNSPEVYESFYAGILRHYPALIALTYPSTASYERMRDSCWAGGRWVTWGTQNKEAPLRKCDGSHWEMKTFDGMANPYMAVAAIVTAGAHGVATNEPLVWGDCAIDPAKLTAEQREKLGVTAKFPENLEDALKALNDDKELGQALGTEFVKRYTDVKKGEMCLLSRMSQEDRRQWILERY